MQSLLVILVYFFYFFTSSLTEAQSSSSHKPFTITNVGYEELPYRLTGERYKNEGPPIILAHGVFNSVGVMRNLALMLHQQGYDVWVYNHPGFGPKGKMSLVHPAYDRSELPEMYRYGAGGLILGIDSMIKILQHERPGTKPTYIGFSMGALSIEMYLSGVSHVDKKGNLIIDNNLAHLRQEKIQSAIMLAGPPLSMQNPTPGYNRLRALLKTIDFLSFGSSRFLPISFGDPESPSKSYKKVIDSFFSHLPMSAKQLVLNDIAQIKNLDPQSLSQVTEFLSQSFSTISLELIHEFARMKSGYISMLEGVPTLSLVGEFDGLANPLEIERISRMRARYAATYETGKEHSVFVLPKIGHLDLPSKRVSEDLALGRAIDAFIQRSSLQRSRSNEFSQNQNEFLQEFKSQTSILCQRLFSL